MSNDSKSSPNGIMKVLGSDIMLGILVALLGLFTALAAYQGALADSGEGDANVEGQKLLSMSNTSYLETTQNVVYDYMMYDGYYFAKDEDAESYYKGSFSEELQANMDRGTDPFDDAYYDAMYGGAADEFDQAMAKFDDAQKAGDKADRYQLVVVVLAVGLALAAWASLSDAENKLRPIFSLISALTTIYGLYLFITLFFS